MNESEIISRAQKGDTAAFGEIYDMYLEKIYNFIYLKTYSKEIAEDLTSDVFFKVLDKIGSFKSIDGASFSSWIYRIAYNKVVDYYKSKKEEFSLDDVLEKGQNDDFGKDIDDKDKLKEVYDYISTLKSDHRDILIMRLWDNLSYKEISELTGKSVDNCKKIFSRNMKVLNENITLTILILLFI